PALLESISQGGAAIGAARVVSSARGREQSADGGSAAVGVGSLRRAAFALGDRRVLGLAEGGGSGRSRAPGSVWPPQGRIRISEFANERSQGKENRTSVEGGNPALGGISLAVL